MRYQELMLEGKPLPEGYITNTWFEQRFKDNKNVLLIVVGATGSGKSWSCIKICEDWYKYKFNKLFPQENICFSLGESAKRIKIGGIEKEEFIIVEEAGVIANALDFQNKIVKMFNYILQSARCKNTGFIFNLPSMNLLNKTARTLAHGIFQTISINKQTEHVTIKPFYLQTNPIHSKIYNKYLRVHLGKKFVTVKRITVGKPDIRIIEPYEKRKMEFVDGKIDSLVEVHNEETQKENPKEIRAIDENIIKLYNEGITNHNEIGKILGHRQTYISQRFKYLEKNNIFIPDYKKKVEIFLQTADKKNRNSELCAVSI